MVIVNFISFLNLGTAEVTLHQKKKGLNLGMHRCVIDS